MLEKMWGLGFDKFFLFYLSLILLASCYVLLALFALAAFSFLVAGSWRGSQRYKVYANFEETLSFLFIFFLRG